MERVADGWWAVSCKKPIPFVDKRNEHAERETEQKSANVFFSISNNAPCWVPTKFYIDFARHYKTGEHAVWRILWGDYIQVMMKLGRLIWKKKQKRKVYINIFLIKENISIYKKKTISFYKQIIV